MINLCLSTDKKFAVKKKISRTCAHIFKNQRTRTIFIFLPRLRLKNTIFKHKHTTNQIFYRHAESSSVRYHWELLNRKISSKSLEQFLRKSPKTSRKSGSVTFVPWWCPNFMQNKTSIQWTPGSQVYLRKKNWSKMIFEQKKNKKCINHA